MKKNILWIDDFDTKSSRNVRTRKKSDASNDRFEIFDLLYRDSVEICQNMYEGIKYILNHFGEFDCVILDIDMNKNLQINLDINSEEGRIWNKFFSYVNLPKEEVLEGNKIEYTVDGQPLTGYLGDNAGYLLVVLLMTMGFPKDRIVMFTAYGNGDDNKNRIAKWEKNFKQASIYIPPAVDKENAFNKSEGTSVHINLKNHLDNLYSDDYYKSRLFLYRLYSIIEKYFNAINYSGCNYNNDSVYNYIVKNKDKKLNKENVLELIDNLLSYIPVNYNNEDNAKIFSKAMKQYAEPFEADYIADRVMKYRTYRVVKLYRNWSAHNIFENDEKMDFKIFCFWVLIESLMFIEIQSDTKDKLLAKESQNAIESVCDICNLFFGSNERKEESDIIEDLQKQNWEICKEQKKIPLDMIEVYDNIGKKNRVRYRYLFDSFMNSFIKVNIDYKDNGCNTDYSLVECDNFHHQLFCLAYCIMKSFTDL